MVSSRLGSWYLSALQKLCWSILNLINTGNCATADGLQTVKHGCARVNRAPLCDPDWTTWAFNWLTGNIQTSDSAEVNPSGVIVVAGFRPYSPEPNETPKCWQTLKIPGNPPPARIYLSVDAGDYCLYKSWSFGFKAGTKL